VISSSRDSAAKAAALQGGADELGQVGLAELHRRHVDRDAQQRRARLMPTHRLGARLLEHPGPDRHDQAAVLGERDELIGADAAALGVVPAQQSLDPDHTPTGDVDLRLVLKLELAALERMREVTLQ
jgi:hypothetical protein